MQKTEPVALYTGGTRKSTPSSVNGAPPVCRTRAGSTARADARAATENSEKTSTRTVTFSAAASNTAPGTTRQSDAVSSLARTTTASALPLTVGSFATSYGNVTFATKSSSRRSGLARHVLDRKSHAPRAPSDTRSFRAFAFADAERLATTRLVIVASAPVPMTIASEAPSFASVTSSTPSTVRNPSASPSVELNPCSSTRARSSRPSTESRTEDSPASSTRATVARASPKTCTGNRPGATYTVCCAVAFAAVNSTGVRTACPPSSRGCSALTTPNSYQSRRSVAPVPLDDAESTIRKAPVTHVPSSLVANGE